MAKMAAVGFLSALGRLIPLAARLALGLGIALTVAISAFSVYSQLVAAHVTDRTVERADATATANRDVVRLTALVLSQSAVVENISQQIKIHDDGVKAATAARPKAAMQIIGIPPVKAALSNA